MEPVRKINEELSIAATVSIPKIQQIAIEGYKSLLYFGLPNYFLIDGQQIEASGLRYVNLPVDATVINSEVVVKVLAEIDQLPKPTLVCCHNVTWAAVIVFMYIAINQGQTLQQAFQRAEELGLFKTYSQLLQEVNF